MYQMQSYEFMLLVVCKEWEMTLENEGSVGEVGGKVQVIM